MTRSEWDALVAVEQLQKITNVVRNTRTDCLHDMALEDVVVLVTSCILCDYDVTPCDLTTEEMGYAMRDRPRWLSESLKRRFEGGTERSDDEEEEACE